MILYNVAKQITNHLQVLQSQTPIPDLFSLVADIGSFRYALVCLPKWIGGRHRDHFGRYRWHFDRKPRFSARGCVNFDLNCPQIDRAERGGSHSSSHSSPPRKHAMNTEAKGPTGTNDSMASGGQDAQTTPKVQTAQRKANQHRKKETKGQRPKPTKPNPEGKPTQARQPQRECRWARPISRKVTRTIIQTSRNHDHGTVGKCELCCSAKGKENFKPWTMGKHASTYIHGYTDTYQPVPYHSIPLHTNILLHIVVYFLRANIYIYTQKNKHLYIYMYVYLYLLNT
jgi:hypothetical protein